MLACVIKCLKTKKKFKLNANVDIRHLPDEVQKELQEKMATLAKDIANALGYDIVPPQASDITLVRELNPEQDVHTDE